MKLNVSQILKGLGQVATTVNPAIGGGLLLAGVVADEFDGVPDEVLENKFVGLGKSAEIIKFVAKKDEFTNDDRLKLIAVAENLEGINELLSKIQKLFK